MSSGTNGASGPLSGIRMIELANIGPVPFCAMVLSDMGAEIIKIDRPEDVARPRRSNGRPGLDRGRRSVALDLKRAEGIELVLDLVETSDVFIEGFRPGVAERLGVGPDQCLSRNPHLIYARITGWGQDGPLSQAPGHDINFIALAGALNSFGRHGDKPVPPLNLVGDFGGGGMLLAMGICAALIHARKTGEGQIVDASMVDGAALLTTMFHGWRASGYWRDERGTNVLDTGAHFYEVYETADQKYIAIGSIEPKFYKVFLERVGIADDPDFAVQMDRARWPVLKEKLASIFRAKTRAEWCSLLEGTDACFAPVLAMSEAPHHPQNLARSTFVEYDGVVQPAPAPRFSRTPSAIQRAAAPIGEEGDEALREWGIDASRIARLHEGGVLESPKA